jgi:WD40 repeat protein
VLEATRIVAARPSHHWEQGSSAISGQLGVPIAQVRRSLFTLVKEWNTDPRRAAQQPIDPPDRDQPFTARLDAFDTGIRGVDKPCRIVVDALEEAVDPLRVAAVLRRVGAAPHVSLLVGTRRSTLEGPDQPQTEDTGLLDSLGVPLADAVIVERDPNAAFDYVRGRILAADLPDVSSEAVIATARAIAAVDQEFLYTRLATYELLRRPELIDSPDGIRSLGSDHRSVFAATVERLRADNPAYDPLLKALAVAQGRGAPIRDGVWAVLASAVAGTPIPEAAIHELIDAASPYLTLDREDDQTVYRLAHRAFAEHFTQESVTSRRWHFDIVRRAIEEIEANESLNPYWLRHTSAHCAESGRDAWEAVSRSAVVDQLRPRAVAADAMRSLFGRGAVPLEIAAIIAGAHHLEAAPTAERWGLMQLFGARLGGSLVAARRRHSATWSLVWGAVSHRPLHAVLTGHTDPVRAVAAVPLPNGRTLLASGSHDRTVRLWDPATGTPAGDPLTGHTDQVWALAAVPLPDGRTLIAAGSADGAVRLWDPTSGTLAVTPLAANTGPVRAMAAVPLPDGRTLLATGSRFDDTVRLWDPATETPAGDLLIGARNAGGVDTLALVPVPDGRTLLASGSDDGTVRLWDPTTRTPARDPDHTDQVWAVAAVPLPNGRTLLASGSDDGTVRLWDPATGTPAGDPLTGHTGSVHAAAAVPLPDGRILLATGGADKTVRLWDPATGSPVGDPLTGHTGYVNAAAAVPLPNGRTLLATGSPDMTVRLWDPATGSPVGDPLTGHTGWVQAVAAVPLPDGRTLLASGITDGTVRLWDPATGTLGRSKHHGRGLRQVGRWWRRSSRAGRLIRDPLTGHTGWVQAVAAVPLRRTDPARQRQRGSDGAAVGPGHRHPGWGPADRPHPLGGGGGGGAAARRTDPARHRQRR